ncbi:MAG: hypothetical protein A2W11_06170 [Ignavibacteria bacterium RBG_16_35_7]|nr:MAG: hypothetical protein A2W11_06170 [Ignavibacteria bacterium RBG_16_35_7]
MKNVILIIVAFALCGCTNQKATIAQTTLAMHDLVAIAAPVANDLCIKKVIKVETCAKLKASYDVFRKSWPIVDDALVVYLKSDLVGAEQTFQAANAVFIKNYADILSILVETGALKGAK